MAQLLVAFGIEFLGSVDDLRTYVEIYGEESPAWRRKVVEAFMVCGGILILRDV